ncbi:hemicentin-1 [Condylostylus longicornis]|uniref:hemicentin-1 n=1 Tax=Condylostylus longicornis TaxID=2530218 RepID=UPI00244D9E6D|nr:hemicentin-1 [Condylostylus longicornis]
MEMSHWITKLFLVLFLLDYTSAGVKDVPIHKMEALTGETIYLPCNVSTHDVGDDIVLILWYREDKGTPIYSVDIRVGDLKAAKRWSDESVFSNRAYFLFDKDPGELAVQSTKESDSGVYRCRVDYKVAQTRNSIVNLTVITPPERISIRDDSGIERSTVVGPYSEGDVVSLKCEVYGGKPTPSISWYRDGIPVASETNIVPNARYVQSEISLGPLGREDLKSRLTCRANNHPRATPLESIVEIDMNFAPLNIKLLGAHQPLSAGRRYDLLCQSSGSRPPAVITWWRDGQRLEETKETTSSDGNQTTSTLSITLSRSDAGKYLSCRAYNQAVPSDPLEDGWRLDIQYIPETIVRLGTSLDPNAIREGTDVYFDCLITAHPSVYKVEWRHNGRPLPHNISQGVIISNHSLVLQGVSRATAGNYSCVGHNAEGDGISPPFKLNILYAPTCMPNQPRIYGVAKQEDAKIKCIVDANPPDVEFKWTFNNSAESIDVATSHISRSGTSSTVTYTPVTELDYGTLLCIASNKIGRQKVPCVFHIIAAGRPDQVHNCTLTNISMTSLTIKCTDGFNGGLPQSFMLEVKDLQSHEIKANVTSPIPRFTVSTLSPGGHYILSIYAFNSKGRSDPANINADMLKMPEKQLTSEKEKPQQAFLLSPVLSLTIGLTLAVMVAGFAVILALRIPCKNSRRSRKELSTDNTSRDGSPGPSDKSTGSKEIDGNESDEKNPDIIPETIDSDDQIDYIRRRQHISTIDTSSPTRGLLSSGTPPPQKYNSSGMTLHTSHNAMGYCTLRSGSQPPVSVGNAAAAAALSMNPGPPHIYSNSVASCTLPRHPSMWPGYTGTIAGVRHIQAPLASLHQLSQQQCLQQANQQQQHLPQHHQDLMTSFPTPSTIAMQHLGQNQRQRICVGGPPLTSTNISNINLNTSSGSGNSGVGIINSNCGNNSSNNIGLGLTSTTGINNNTNGLNVVGVTTISNNIVGLAPGTSITVGGNGGLLSSTNSNGNGSGLSEDEASVQTPLMIKRESTV